MGLTIALEDENGNAIQTIPEELDYSELGKIEIGHYTLLKYNDFFWGYYFQLFAVR
jgi:hypothetical protein